MLKTVLLGLAGVLVAGIAGLLIVAATKPDSFRVQRSASIKAPPERIFALINDLQSWSAWSPYETKDPDMARRFSGAAAGKGAVYEWDGDRNVGQGRMEILDASPAKVAIKLDFAKPFEAHNMAEFTLTAKGETTDVVWAMHGPAPFISKVMQVFFDMDRMVGQDFEAGLASMKAVAEK